MVDTPMLKKIKIIQINELKTWKGLQVEYISRPGISNILIHLLGISNLFVSKKLQKSSEYFKVISICYNILTVRG